VSLVKIAHRSIVTLTDSSLLNHVSDDGIDERAHLLMGTKKSIDLWRLAKALRRRDVATTDADLSIEGALQATEPSCPQIVTEPSLWLSEPGGSGPWFEAVSAPGSGTRPTVGVCEGS
jgi:hypothetical protein